MSMVSFFSDFTFFDLKQTPPNQGWEEIVREWQDLVKSLDYYDDLYYQNDESPLEDTTYDHLRQRLIHLETLYPSLRSVLSPSQKVGSPLKSKGFQKVAHHFPLYSLDNAFGKEALEEFLIRTRRHLKKNGRSFENVSWIAEPKIDGVSVVLSYRNGQLIQARTRGDGQWGENITENIKNLPNIPRFLQHMEDHPWPEYLEIRAEVYILLQDFQKLNASRKSQGLQEFSNPRNAASGSLRQLDPSITAQRPLILAVHGIQFQLSKDIAPSYGQWMKHLKSCGFTWARDLWPNPVHSSPLCQPLLDDDSILNAMIHCAKLWEDIRADLPFLTDGIVFKIDDLDMQQYLGASSRFVRYAIAYKTQSTKSISYVKDIQIQVGRSGALTPVACIQPVQLGGVIIGKASLHNYEDMWKKDIRKGDCVEIQRAGDVIPQIVQRVPMPHQARQDPLPPPKHCPSCQSLVAHGENGNFFCPQSWQCPAQRLEKLAHFASRDALNIEGLGKKILFQLHHEGLVKEPQDLFNLSSRDLGSLKHWGKKSVENFFTSLEKSKTIPLDRFIYSLGIPFVGLENAKILQKAYKTWNDFIHQIHHSDAEKSLQNLEGIGPKITQALMEFFKNPIHQNMISKLLRHLSIQEYVPFQALMQAHPLKGKSVVFSGSFESYSRKELENLALQMGAFPQDRVHAETHFLIVGQENEKLFQHQKYRLAEKYGIPIASQDVWKDWVQSLIRQS